MTHSFEIENKTGVTSRGSLPKAIRRLSRQASKSGWLLGGALLVHRGEALAEEANESADVAAAAVPAAAVPAEAVPLGGGEAGDLSALACSVEDGPIALCDEGSLEGFASDELVAVLGGLCLGRGRP